MGGGARNNRFMTKDPEALHTETNLIAEHLPSGQKLPSFRLAEHALSARISATAVASTDHPA